MQFIIAFIIFAFSAGAFGQATAPTAAPSEAPATAKEHARVFITDSQSWEVGGGAGGSGAAFGAESHGGARPQTAEIIKTFGERCPDVVTNNIQTKTDYIVVLDHEGGKGYLTHRNKVAVFNRVTGDSVVSKSTLSLGGSVQTACEAIAADWSKNSAKIRDAELAEAAAKERPSTPQIQQIAQSSATKLSVVSNPAGADIEVDGAFVGNTPSTIDITAGDHTITVSKNGYKNWERKLKASGGNVSLNVELETGAK
jgi:PEGA domain